MNQQLTAEEREYLSEKETRQNLWKQKLAHLICQATQKTNYRCNVKCDREGKCAYCLVMAEELLASGVTVPTKCEECRFLFKNNGHNKHGCPIDGGGSMTGSDFCSCGENREGET